MPVPAELLRLLVAEAALPHSPEGEAEGAAEAAGVRGWLVGAGRQQQHVLSAAEADARRSLADACVRSGVLCTCLPIYMACMHGLCAGGGRSHGAGGRGEGGNGERETLLKLDEFISSLQMTVCSNEFKIIATVHTALRCWATGRTAAGATATAD